MICVTLPNDEPNILKFTRLSHCYFCIYKYYQISSVALNFYICSKIRTRLAKFKQINFAACEFACVNFLNLAFLLSAIKLNSARKLCP